MLVAIQLVLLDPVMNARVRDPELPGHLRGRTAVSDERKRPSRNSFGYSFGINTILSQTPHGASNQMSRKTGEDHSGPHDPFELRSILIIDLDALRQGRHTEPPTIAGHASNPFGKDYETPPTTPELKR